MADNVQPLTGKILNLSTHYSLFKEQDLYYMLNGDIQGNEMGNAEFFVQNVLSNELCHDFGADYTYNGSVKLNNNEYAVFFIVGGGSPTSEIGIFNTSSCIYTKIVDDPCLNFVSGYLVRGVYKFNNSENDRRIYFIDGLNPNRYLDIDQDYPKTYTGNKCDSCDYVEGSDLDCEQLRMNRIFQVPSIEVSQEDQGQILPGVYQFGIGFGEDNLVMTDFYFSRPFKAYSESSNISFRLNIDCVDNPFTQFILIAVTQTQENGLVVYKVGSYEFSTTQVTIANFTNASVLDTTTALQKKTVYDYSNHIATNSETLLLGKHQMTEDINYQPQANNIEVYWNEVKVPKKDAHLYPSFMRDEVYAVSIEWFRKNMVSAGKGHIPGRVAEAADLESVPSSNDIYEVVGCEPITPLAWQIENTASVLETFEIDCEDCSGAVISKIGATSYWEAENLTYPNDSDVWADLACEKIRHHKMPSNQITHIHDDFTTETTASATTEEITVVGQDGSEYTYIQVIPAVQEVIESNCVNILTISLSNIEHPKDSNGNYIDDIAGYRILVADREGNKSVLHKGLIFNMWKDMSTSKLDIYYPNYPFNDLHSDVFLTTSQIDSDTADVTKNDPLVTGKYQRNRFTYHSPDIHYREAKQEFGTEMKIYGQEVGWIDGNFSDVYLHPKSRLGYGGIQDRQYTNHACQLNSVAHYSKWVPWDQDFLSRFQIETSQYLLPINQLTSDNIKVNNWIRESSYYVKVGRNVDDPSEADVSRVLASEIDNFTGQHALPKFNYFDEVKRSANYTGGGGSEDKNLQAVSYYVGIKVKQPDQYGSLENINYHPVTDIQFVDDPTAPSGVTYSISNIYGGDIYISKHSLVRKMPMFTEWLSDVPITTEINYRDYRNIWYPRFWYDNLTHADDEYNIDGFFDAEGGGDILAYGKVYMFVTGVIDYWCESEFIGSFRDRDFTPNGSFYPKAGFNDLVRADIIPYDNKFLYNFSLLNKDIEILKHNLTPTLDDADFVVTWSKINDQQSKGDPWLQFLPLNYTILPRIYGKFTGIHCTDMYNLMFIFEDGILYSQLNFTINTNEGTSVLLGQGDIFDHRLLRLSNEDTGYVGSVDPLSFINTRFGTYFVDRKRKKIFKWNGQLEDKTGNMFTWLQSYLSDNEYVDYNSSIITVFDNFSENLYISSKDRDRWTLSYKPKLEGLGSAFISFHSFTPDYYLTNSNTFLSYRKLLSNGMWKHNSQGSYQQYYGVQYPFDIGIVINNKFTSSELQALQIFCEWIKINNFGEYIYSDLFFDKIFAYNNRGTTGLRTIYLKDKNNARDTIVQNEESNLISEVTKVADSLYRTNKFESILQDKTKTVIQWGSAGMTYTPVNYDQSIKPTDRPFIGGNWIKIHLISTDNSTHKILLQLLANKNDEIKR